MNKDNLFIWNKKSVQMAPINYEFEEKDIITLPIQIDKDDKESYIKDIRTG